MKDQVTIELHISALNTDLIHWLMSCVKIWNKRMWTAPMVPTKFIADGMNKFEYDTQDLEKFFEKWEHILPYKWGQLS